MGDFFALPPVNPNNKDLKEKKVGQNSASGFENCVFDATKTAGEISENLFDFSKSESKLTPVIKKAPKEDNYSTEKVVKKAEELLSQNINEGNGKYTKLTQGRKEAWCADTVNYIWEQACGKTPFGLNKDGTYKANVQELKDWGIENGRFKPAAGDAEIGRQLKTMKPGDVIIWKSPFKAKLEGLGTVTRHASHTGIVKEVSKEGVVSVIEGNANVFKLNKKGEYILDQKRADLRRKRIGKRKVVNPHDGLILKKYSTQGLINEGYSGYIDMQNLKMDDSLKAK